MNTLEQLKKENHGFLTSETIKDLVKIAPDHMVLIRCGGCRLIVRAKEVEYVVNTFDSVDYDYVRDVAFLAKDMTNHVTH